MVESASSSNQGPHRSSYPVHHRMSHSRATVSAPTPKTPAASTPHPTRHTAYRSDSLTLPTDLPQPRGDHDQKSTLLTASADWRAPVTHSEWTFHQLAPYIGKTKSSMASSLIRHFATPGTTLYEPFSGSGTIAFESWVAGCNTIATDLNPYARLLTRAKLTPYKSRQEALHDVHIVSNLVARARRPSLHSVPPWVRQFFHPDTLAELLLWTHELQRRQKWFLLACLMGILHHQRPGFLSYPSSHSAPYLRTNRYPSEQFPDMYTYRSVLDRLTAKVSRAFRRVPPLNFALRRCCYSRNAARFHPSPVDLIVTSPPYMKQLDYGRDNRLRLWFLGCTDTDSLDHTVSPKADAFLELLERCFIRWRRILKADAPCVLIIGSQCARARHADLAATVTALAQDAGYILIDGYTESLPYVSTLKHRVIRSTPDSILVLRARR